MQWNQPSEAQSPTENLSIEVVYTKAYSPYELHLIVNVYRVLSI